MSIKVTFSQSPAQSYGFDDMDSAVSSEGHLSVKRKAATMVHVKIEGDSPYAVRSPYRIPGPDRGAAIHVTLGPVAFVCDDPTVAKPGPTPAGNEFDLPVNGQDTGKGATVLRAMAQMSVDVAVNVDVGSINVNTYNEKQVTATVMKVYDSTSVSAPPDLPQGTTLRFPHLDVSSIPTLINPKYKDAVAVMSLTDQSPGGGAWDIAFDTDKNGKLTWDIKAGGGAELNAITSQFTVAGQKVVIVRDMVSVYYLAANAAKDATTLTINDSGSFLQVNSSYPVGVGATRETVNITAKSGATLTLAAPLANAHSSGETLEFPAAGWGGNPIVIIEGSASEDTLKWTFGHELGHAILELADVNAAESIMNYSQGWTDHRLRIKPLPLPAGYPPPKHPDGTGTETQWQTIPRT